MGKPLFLRIIFAPAIREERVQIKVGGAISPKRFQPLSHFLPEPLVVFLLLLQKGYCVIHNRISVWVFARLDLVTDELLEIGFDHNIHWSLAA
jgi:hypothetical protein